MNPSDILEKAADLIEPEGAWTQGAGSRNSDGLDLEDIELEEGRANTNPVCWCAAGALYEVTGLWSFENPAVNALTDILGCPIPEWNDAPERTQAEVVAKLREAAALARQEGR